VSDYWQIPAVVCFCFFVGNRQMSVGVVGKQVSLGFSGEVEMKCRCNGTALLLLFLTKLSSHPRRIDNDAINLATKGLHRIRDPQIQVVKYQARNRFIVKKINNIIIQYAFHCSFFL
jgi:hypothetical protein